MQLKLFTKFSDSNAPSTSSIIIKVGFYLPPVKLAFNTSFLAIISNLSISFPAVLSSLAFIL